MDIYNRGIQSSSIRRIKPNMKNRIKKTTFFLSRSFAMKKEFGQWKKNLPNPLLQDRIIRRIKVDNVFFIRFYAIASDMDIILYIWSCAAYYLA